MMLPVDSMFALRLMHPKGSLAPFVQAIWSASVSCEASGNVKRWLQGDGCSGIIFNLGEEIYLDDIKYSANQIVLPITQQAHSISLPPGSKLCGFQFHPGVGYSFLGGHCDQAVVAEDHFPSLPYDLRAVAEKVSRASGHYSRMIVLYKWLSEVTAFFDSSPSWFSQAVKNIESNGLMNTDLPLTQRQVERQFKKRLRMSPKHYQRVVRVKCAIERLKEMPSLDLAELAIRSGFSDQSHMTREFKKIAQITPGEFSRIIAKRLAKDV